MRKQIRTAHEPTGAEVASNRKVNTETCEDNENSSYSNTDLEDTVDVNKEVNQQPHHNRLTHNEVTLQRDDLIQRGKVKGRTLSADSSDICTHDDNPILNTLEHDVEFEDGDVREHMDNAIYENMLARANFYGHIVMALQEMLNHGNNDTARELKNKHFYAND